MNLIEELKRRILICDGAMGSFLVGKARCPEELNLYDPDLVESITRKYVEAGADLVQTNTFGANPLKLSDYGLREFTSQINKKAVEIAKKAAKGRVFIYASCGPTGKLLVPFGDTEEVEVIEAFKVQVSALLEEGVDAISIETMTDLKEAVLAVKTIRSLSMEIPIFASITFNKTQKGYYTIMGNSIAECINELTSLKVDVIGSNCGNGFKEMIDIAKEFRKHSASSYLIFQPNAGIPYYENGKIVYPETPEVFISLLPELLKEKISIIGGCCGTTEAHINALKQAMDMGDY